MIPCGICERTFATQRGASQHKRRVHPDEYFTQSISESGLSSRTRYCWTEDEVTALAVCEVEATRTGNNVNMNRYLRNMCPRRTYDSIKGKRASPEYRRLVKSMLLGKGFCQIPDRRDKEMTASQTEMVSSVDAETEGTQAYSDGPCQTAFKKAIYDSVRTLRRMTEFKTQALLSTARSMENRTILDQGLMDWCANFRGGIIATLAYRLKMGKVQRDPAPNARKRKRDSYATTQRLYNKDPKKVVNRLLDNSQKVLSNSPKASQLFQFWSEAFGHEGTQVVTPVQGSGLCQTKIWYPVTCDEVKATEPRRGTTTGPDGITATAWRVIPREVRTLFYNLIMFRCDLGEELANSSTIFIPKSINPTSPSEFRPISIASVITRQLHGILARRLQSRHQLNPSQKGFRRMDGVAENILTLKAILVDARERSKELHIASIDIRNAFGSITHSAIMESLRQIGVDEKSVSYIQKAYGQASTNLIYDGETSFVKIKRGVMQGDPLSPILFNIALDRALDGLEGCLGYSFGNNTKVCCVAYADDILLISGSELGLQHNLSKLANKLGEMGLAINTNKTSVLSMIHLGKEKKWVVDKRSRFELSGQALKQLGPSDTWKYLGISFCGPKVVQTSKVGLIEEIRVISSAPLKPQQKLHLLKQYVLPRHLHTMVLGKVKMVDLEELDREVRKAIREWLKLPMDLTKAYFHAQVSAGGLGVMSLRTAIPQQSRNRMMRFAEKDNDLSQSFDKSFYYQENLKRSERYLRKCGDTKEAQTKYWEDQLYNKIDTADLKDVKHCPESTGWIGSHPQSLKVSGREFVGYHKIRAGCLPTHARRSRGREDEALCRSGCPLRETNYHVIQQCDRTEGGRSRRHNHVVERIEAVLKKRGFTVHKEPQLLTTVGMRKPDLIVVCGEKAYIMDVQIVKGDIMKKARSSKKHKYQDIVGFPQVMREMYGCTKVSHQPITISYKGVMERKAREMLLKKFNFSKKKLTELLLGVMRGSWLNWLTFNRSSRIAWMVE